MQRRASILLLEEQVESALEPPIYRLRHPLERETAVDPAHHARNRRLYPLHAPPDGGGEEGYVAFPPRRPAGRLECETLLGSGEDQVERRQAAHAGNAEAEDLGRPGLGDAERHFSAGGKSGEDVGFSSGYYLRGDSRNCICF